MRSMYAWATLQTGTTPRSVWQRLRSWLGGGTARVHVTPEIAHLAILEAVDDNRAPQRLAIAR